MSLLAVPAGEPGTIGAVLAARPEGNAAFAFFFPINLGKGVGCGGSPVPGHPGGCECPAPPSHHSLLPTISPWLSMRSFGSSLSVSSSSWGRSVAVLAGCNPLIPGNPIMSPRGCFQFWPLGCFLISFSTGRGFYRLEGAVEVSLLPFSASSR